MHVFRFVFEQRDAGREPVKAALFDKVTICKDPGNASGIGGWILLLSRCNSRRLLNEESDDGMVVVKPVAVKSLEKE